MPLRLDHPPVDMGGVYAIYPPGGRLPAKARVFIDFLAARFGGTPPWERRLPAELGLDADPGLSPAGP
jgi:hypothetical protein